MEKIYSVTEIVSQLKVLVERTFNNVLLEGEISNLSHSSAGHTYLTLSDSSSSLSVAIFKFDGLRNPVLKQMKNGDKVIIMGALNLYAKRGTIQLVGKKIFPHGVGDIKIKYEKLKKDLESEGIFSPELKKKIPRYANRVAVVTALSGAALQDFINVFKRRALWGEVIVVPTVVQGEKAPAQIISSLKQVQQIELVDAVVLTRGGGSFEDLYCFNDEQLVRYIGQYPFPLISAIGHQVDLTLTDLVADFRVETPTAAAEILTSQQREIGDRFKYLSSQLLTSVQSWIYDLEGRLVGLSPALFVQKLTERFNYFEKKVIQATGKLNKENIVNLNELFLLLDECMRRAEYYVKSRFDRIEQQILGSAKILDALNPYGVLKRGYSLVQTEEGKGVFSQKDFEILPKKQKLILSFHDGKGEVNVSD